MNRYSNVIWDWNGTLLNDVALCVDIANSILSNHNQTRLDIKSYRSVFGFPITEYYEKLGIDFEKESFEQLTRKFITDYNTDVKKSRLQNHANNMLDTLKVAGITQYVLTAAYKKDALHLLEHYDILKYFKMVEGLDNYRAESKIDRGHHLLKVNEIDKTKTVLIGDTIHDLEVANELGVHCILVANGHQSFERLQSAANKNTRVLANLGLLKEFMLYYD